MSQFEYQVDQAFASFYAKEYLSCCRTLIAAYMPVLERGDEALPPAYYMEKALITVEELVQLPELEMTDHLVSIIAEERAALFQENGIFWQSRAGILSRLLGLLQDCATIIAYWDEYLGGMGGHPHPSITIGVVSRGKYVLYENIYGSVPAAAGHH